MMAKVIAVLAAPTPWTRLSDRAGEARDHEQRDTEHHDGFAAESVRDGSINERRHGEAKREDAHRQADFGEADAKHCASRSERRQIDIDTGIGHGREKAEQQCEAEGGRSNLHDANLLC
jgi:hypothetical protein